MSEHASMNCPVCKTALTMSERQGIEIDFCQTCRGVWLDRGELDKIVERSAAAPPPEAPRPSAPPTYRPDRHDDHRHYDDRGRHGHHGKRRKSFFEELFD